MKIEKKVLYYLMLHIVQMGKNLCLLVVIGE